MDLLLLSTRPHRNLLSPGATQSQTTPGTLPRLRERLDDRAFAARFFIILKTTGYADGFGK